MAREFARAFYKSKAWKKTREYIYKRDNGLCQDCLKDGHITPGKEVHHKTFLTPDNIDDPIISNGETNLILLCLNCHHLRHNNRVSTRDGLIFNEMGELVQR